MAIPGPSDSGLVSLAEAYRRDQGRRLGRQAWLAVILVLIPLGLITVAVAGSLATYRAVQAAEGHGTKGYFVDVHGALGEFRLPDGQITRPHVTFADSPSALRKGAVVPALDTGDVTYVFARHGSRHWETNAGLLAFLVLAFVAWLWFVPLRMLHKRRAGPVLAQPATPSGRRARAAKTVASAVADPAWTKQTIGLLNSALSTRRVNTALHDASDRKRYPLLITMGVPLTDMDRMVAGVPGESDRLEEVTDTVSGLIAGHGVLAATVADPNAWVFLIYTGSSNWLAEFESQMRSELADHLVAFRARRDPAWRAYRDLWKVAPRKLRAREQIVLVTLLPLGAAAEVARYGPAWMAAIFVLNEAWTATIAFGPRPRLISAQRAHPGVTFLVVAGIFWALLFPIGALVVHPSSPWVCAVGAAVISAAIVLALVPSQLRFLASTRESAALQPPSMPTP